MEYKIRGKQKRALDTFTVKMLTEGVFISVDGKDITVDDFYKGYIVTREDAQLLENLEEVYMLMNLKDENFNEVFDNNQEHNKWTVFEYNFGGPETYQHSMRCEHQRAKAMTEIIMEILNERNLGDHYTCQTELGNDAKITLIRTDPNIRRSCDDVLKAKDYESLHKKTIMYCDCDDSNLIHEKEVETIFDSLYEAPLFHSALIIREENMDVAHKTKPAKYYILDGINELDEHLFSYDFKNGCDIGISKEGTLAIAIYGSGYEYKGDVDFDKVLLHIDPVINSVGIEEFGEITKDKYDSLSMLRKDASVQLYSIKDKVKKEVKKMYRKKQKDYEKRR